MKFRVVGPRILLKVPNLDKKDQTYQGTSILMAEHVREKETTFQTVGEVVQLGSTAFKRKDAYCDGVEQCKVGDKVHFSRYGAIRLMDEQDQEFEYWVLMDKDILALEL